MCKNEMIYGLTLLYSEIKYNYGMFNRNHINLDDEYKKILNELDKIDTIFDYYMLLKRFATLLNDTHTFVSFPNDVYEKENIGILPFDIILIDDKWYINMWEEKFNDLFTPYCELVEVNGLITEDYFEKYVYPYSSHASYKDTLAIRNVFILGKIGNSLNIQIYKENKSVQIAIPYINIIGEYNWVTYEKHNNYSNKAKSLYISEENCFELFEYNNIGIIDCWSFSNNGLMKEMINEIGILKDKKGIIIDLRDNHGGNGPNADDLIALFVNQDYYIERTNYRVHKAYGKARAYFKVSNGLKTYEDYLKKYDINANPEYQEYYQDYYNQHFEYKEDKCLLNKNYLNILNSPVVLLVGQNTASAAESFVMAYKYFNRGIIIGQRTIGAGGQPLYFSLPFGGNAAINTEDSLMFDGKPFNNIGYTPDVIVKYSIDDYCDDKKRNVDKEFELAMEYFEEYKK